MSTNCKHIISSKLDKKQVVYMGGCLLGITTLFLVWFWIAFKKQEKKLCSESYIVFKQAMQNEEKLYVHRRFSSYDSKNSPNDIPREEKSKWCVQDYLTFCNPNRSILDSLFRISLIENGLEAQAAVRYICKGDTVDTSLDSLFYKTAFALDPIVYRLDTNKDNNIVLRAYVKFPFKTVLTQNPLLILIFCLWLISCSLYLIRRKKSQVPIIKATPVSTAPLVTEQRIVWIKLPCNLLFDAKYGGLQYNGNVFVRLKNNPLRLFDYFVKTEGHKLTYKDICIEILGRRVEGEVTDSDKKVVATLVSRLRIDLTSIPVIEIKNIRTTGFEMVFKETD